MNRLAIALLLVVWIALATACSYKFGDKTIDLSAVGTIKGVLDVQGDRTGVFLNFCENIKDGKWNMYAIDPSDDDLMSFGSVDAVPLPVAASTGGVNTLKFNNGEANCYNRGYKAREVVFILTCGPTSSTFSIAENDCTYAIPLTVDCDGGSGNSGLSSRTISLIIGLVFGLLAVVIFAVIVYRCNVAIVARKNMNHLGYQEAPMGMPSQSTMQWQSSSANNIQQPGYQPYQTHQYDDAKQRPPEYTPYA